MTAQRDGDTVVRLTLNERVQHVVLMVSVLLLMVSGLSLRFADTGFGQAIIAAEGGIEGRGTLHRISAVALLVLWFYHTVYVVFSERGHAQLMAMKPRCQDLRDLLATLRANLTGTGTAPRFGWFDFRQKFQYWAVALGCTLMAVTGLALWFESQAMAVMPKWVIDVTRIVHSGEGLLIFVLLFVWHLYDTHLRPGVFPMDRSWLHGRMTREQLRQRHALEYERRYGAPSDKEPRP
jgi:cytochrome b subunit of formate dehydrogenase